MGQQTSTYPPELRERAVRMVPESGRPIRRVAADLGIHHEALRLWVRKAEVDGIPVGSRMLATEVEQELKALRTRNAEFERSNQILRAASPCFATELDQTRRR